MRFRCSASIHSSRGTIERKRATSFAHIDGNLVRSMTRCHTRNFFPSCFSTLTSERRVSRTAPGWLAERRRRNDIVRKEETKRRKGMHTIKWRAWAGGERGGRRRDATERLHASTARSKEGDRGCIRWRCYRETNDNPNFRRYRNGLCIFLQTRPVGAETID